MDTNSKPTTECAAQVNPQSTLDRLKAWIDGERLFYPSKTSESPFLWKPCFTQADLREALIYADNRCNDVVAECAFYDQLARQQYRSQIWTLGFQEKLESGEIDSPLDTCLPIEDLTHGRIRRIKVAREPDFRRSIASLARYTYLIKQHILARRAEIGRAQSPEAYGSD
ncbi:hypothetical protein BDY17DRAFT_30064 [Neohortaea acidophila]|uniref:Uncharacterized protein n=1 Tax=Neohortaea acidophila TaxID=245834 RepID=A0A6A6PK19_9PEZI|nr:uncharacterized protein BDY17DRAFT_30064 [Neohortaea acidophila]KAF2480014.1 hypothetical protein BDY17DRAFT_30064 [Neohortaea acidophila]